MADSETNQSPDLTPKLRQSDAARVASRLLREELQILLDRLVWPVVVILLVLMGGVIGFKLTGPDTWTWFDAMYITTYTIATVGYGELPGMTHSAQVFAVALIWTSVVAMLYMTATVTAFIVEEHLGQLFRLRKMEQIIANMKGHFILVGTGNTGIHVLGEMIATRRPVVVVEHDKEVADKIREQHPGVPVIHGDALDEEVLKMAGIDRAYGIVTTLPQDGQNMMLVVNARYLNNEIKIATRCVEHHLISRFRRAGADYVVSPNFIGGMRLVSEMIRPHTTGFLDKMLRGKVTIRVDEVVIAERSKLAGKTLESSRMHEETGLNAVAISYDGGVEYTYNPGPTAEIRVGTVIVAIGQPIQFEKLRALAAG